MEAFNPEVLDPAALQEITHQRRCFPGNFPKRFKNSLSQNISEQLLFAIVD